MYKSGQSAAVAIDYDGLLMKTIIDPSGQVALLKERGETVGGGRKDR